MPEYKQAEKNHIHNDNHTAMQDAESAKHNIEINENIKRNIATASLNTRTKQSTIEAGQIKSKLQE